MFRSASLFIYWHIFHSSGFHHICNIKCRLDCRYSPQNIFNAKNFNPHKKPISLLNVPICTQGMQRTWWAEVLSLSLDLIHRYSFVYLQTGEYGQYLSVKEAHIWVLGPWPKMVHFIDLRSAQVYCVAIFIIRPFEKRDVLCRGNVRPSVCPSVCPSVRPSVRVFRTFLQHALRYQF